MFLKTAVEQNHIFLQLKHFESILLKNEFLIKGNGLLNYTSRETIFLFQFRMHLYTDLQ